MIARAVQITDRAALPEDALFARLREVASLGAEARRNFAVMLRDPELSGRALAALGSKLAAALHPIGAALWVNDRIDLALALDAQAIHLGRRSIPIAEARRIAPRLLVSASCHSVDDVVARATEGAGVVTLSPIFASPGKGPPLGEGALTEARAALDARGLSNVTIVALGGVTAVRAALCFERGAGALAAIRASLVSILDEGRR